MLPANPSGGDAHETDFVYYTVGTNAQDSSCGNHPEWAGLECDQKPAAQPGTSGQPNLPTTQVDEVQHLRRTRNRRGHQRHRQPNDNHRLRRGWPTDQPSHYRHQRRRREAAHHRNLIRHCNWSSRTRRTMARSPSPARTTRWDACPHTKTLMATPAPTPTTCSTASAHSTTARTLLRTPTTMLAAKSVASRPRSTTAARSAASQPPTTPTAILQCRPTQADSPRPTRTTKRAKPPTSSTQIQVTPAAGLVTSANTTSTPSRFRTTPGD